MVCWDVNLEWCLHDSVWDAHKQWPVLLLLKLSAVWLLLLKLSAVWLLLLKLSAVWLLLLELRIVFGRANVFFGAHGARKQPRHLFSEP